MHGIKVRDVLVHGVVLLTYPSLFVTLTSTCPSSQSGDAMQENTGPKTPGNARLQPKVCNKENNASVRKSSVAPHQNPKFGLISPNTKDNDSTRKPSATTLQKTKLVIISANTNGSAPKMSSKKILRSTSKARTSQLQSPIKAVSAEVSKVEPKKPPAVAELSPEQPLLLASPISEEVKTITQHPAGVQGDSPNQSAVATVIISTTSPSSPSSPEPMKEQDSVALPPLAAFDEELHNDSLAAQEKTGLITSLAEEATPVRGEGVKKAQSSPPLCLELMESEHFQAPIDTMNLDSVSARDTDDESLITEHVSIACLEVMPETDNTAARTILFVEEDTQTKGTAEMNVSNVSIDKEGNDEVLTPATVGYWQNAENDAGATIMLPAAIQDGKKEDVKESAAGAQVFMQPLDEQEKEQESNSIFSFLPSLEEQNKADGVPLWSQEEGTSGELFYTMPSSEERQDTEEDTATSVLSPQCSEETAEVTEWHDYEVAPGAFGSKEVDTSANEIVLTLPAEAMGIELIDDNTRKLVTVSKYLQFKESERRVVCTLTEHELKPDYMEILNYLGSKRVQRLLAEGPFDMSVRVLFFSQ